MRTDFDNWTPYNVNQIAELFKEVEIHWGIGGGWALELYKGYHSLNRKFNCYINWMVLKYAKKTDLILKKLHLI